MKKAKFYIRWLLVFLWMSVIFYFSSQEGQISHQRSFSIAIFLERIIEYIVSREIITDFNRKLFELFVRKFAHISEYFILSMLFFKALEQKEKCYSKIAAKSFLFSFLYAVSDEIHQIFVAQRGPSLTDVMIDTVGIIFYLIPRIFIEKLKARKQEN